MALLPSEVVISEKHSADKLRISFEVNFLTLFWGYYPKGGISIENREVKSDVFSMLMEDKHYALQVYNALNDSNYTDPELIEYCNLEKGISLTIRNDAAFIIGNSINIYEHQSTYSPNMPLRSLFYVADILKERYYERDIYSRKRIIIPEPKFVVFYNGSEERPAERIIRLNLPSVTALSGVS